ncbi:MAG: membrane protein insertase YidC [Planctomycetes bacterium]|nr:membrane protein insertase YidC [Planctomycetota bacterium]
MERRVFVTLIAAFLFTLLYWKFFPPRAGREEAGPEGRPAAVQTDGAGPADDPAAASAVGAPQPLEGSFPQTEAGEVAVAPFESDDLLVEFTNLGAAVSQVYLKKYYVDSAARGARLDDTAHWVALFPPAAASFGNALTLRELTAQSAARYHLERVHWAVEQDETGADGRRLLRFAYRSRDGLEFVKEFECLPAEHFLHVRVGVRALDLQLGGVIKEFLLRVAGGIRDLERGWFTLAPEGVAMLVNQYDEPTVRRFDAEKLEGSPESVAAQGSSAVAWGGCCNLYFTALLAPEQRGAATAVDLRSRGEEDPEAIQAELVVPLPVAREGELTLIGFRYYVGPKDQDLLERQGLTSFQQLIEEDYGSWTSFRWINKVLLAVMRFFHGFTGNWGVAIILLTLLVRICIFPITRTQQVSMQRYAQKMQVLKPKLDALKEKFKDKPQKFAQEQMKLLKEHNAKPPVLGCLTTFITFPVFIGMFQILRTAIELRQAAFVGWIGDLSLPDAMFAIPGIGHDFNLLPILATAAFVTQMALAPKAADPQAQQQQKIMLIMPLVFGVMFYGYAAGLSLYMLTSSLYGIFEYKFIRQKFFPASAPVAAAQAAGGKR